MDHLLSNNTTVELIERVPVGAGCGPPGGDPPVGHTALITTPEPGRTEIVEYQGYCLGGSNAS